MAKPECLCQDEDKKIGSGVIISSTVAPSIFVMLCTVSDIAPQPALLIILGGHTEYQIENYRFSESQK